MPNIRSLDMKLVDDLFDMGGGYVLDFSDRTMSSFFAEELDVDIDDPGLSGTGHLEGQAPALLPEQGGLDHFDQDA